MILGGFIIIFAAILMLIEETDQMNETPTSSSSTMSSRLTTKTPVASNEEVKPTASSFDINGPPPVEKETVVTKTFSLFQSAPTNKVDGQSSNTNGERSLYQPAPETKVTKPSANTNTDDEVPRAAAGVVPTAAEALLCPDSVVDYVINATDLKDECDGLRKAFSKYCADTEGSDTKQSKPTRRLQESDEHANNSQYKINPVLIWDMRLRYMVESLKEWWGASTGLEAGGSSEYNDHLWIEDVYSIHQPRRLNEAAEKFLKEETSAERGETVTNENDDENSNEDENANEDTEIDQLLDPDDQVTKTPDKTAPKVPKMSLDLPIKGHHLSDKALTESLLLHQDDKSVMASVKAIQNATNANSNSTENVAAADAAASLKAVSDTTELVSNLLNDPSSVEARTCCTSVLSVFHEICSVDEEESLSDRQLFISVAVIVVCGLVKSLIRHFQIRWLPEAAGCVLVGGKFLSGLSFRENSWLVSIIVFLLSLISGRWLGYLLFPSS